MSDRDKQKENYYKNHDYTDNQPIYIDNDVLRPDQKYKLTQSKYFCMIPWIHMHAFPTGQAYPCCLSDSNHPIGNLHTNTIREVWNSPAYKEIRSNMMIEKECKECNTLKQKICFNDSCVTNSEEFYNIFNINLKNS